MFRFYQKKVVAFFRVNHVILVSFVVVTGMVSAFAERSPQALPGDGELGEHFQRMTTYHGRMDGNVPEGAVLFIGDSITQGLCVAAVCEHGVNYGIGSDTTAGVLDRLHLYPSIARAAAVVLAIGVNDLGRRDNEFILENLREILTLLSEHVPVVVSAVLPLDETVKTVGVNRNARIVELNASIASLCGEFPSSVFVDATPLLLDDAGNLAASNHVGDGVHPNTRGYEIWIKVLCEGLAKAIKDEKCEGDQ